MSENEKISINAANKDVLKRKWSVHILIGHSLLHLNNLVSTFIRVKSVWITNLLSWKICHLAVTFGSSDNAVKYSHYFLHKTGIKHGKNTEFCSKKKRQNKKHQIKLRSVENRFECAIVFGIPSLYQNKLRSNVSIESCHFNKCSPTCHYCHHRSIEHLNVFILLILISHCVEHEANWVNHILWSSSAWISIFSMILWFSMGLFHEWISLSDWESSWCVRQIPILIVEFGKRWTFCYNHLHIWSSCRKIRPPKIRLSSQFDEFETQQMAFDWNWGNFYLRMVDRTIWTDVEI